MLIIKCEIGLTLYTLKYINAMHKEKTLKRISIGYINYNLVFIVLFSNFWEHKKKKKCQLH